MCATALHGAMVLSLSKRLVVCLHIGHGLAAFIHKGVQRPSAAGQGSAAQSDIQGAHFSAAFASWFRAGPPMLKSTQPTTGRKRVAMMATRLSLAASSAISEAACAWPAAIMVPAAVLHAAALTTCSCIQHRKHFTMLPALQSECEVSGPLWAMILELYMPQQ